MPVTSIAQLMTPPQVGRVLGVETYDVLILLDRGDLPRVRGDDGLIYVPAEAVEAYSQSQR